MKAGVNRHIVSKREGLAGVAVFTRASLVFRRETPSVSRGYGGAIFAVLQITLFPTLSELAGFEAPATSQGKSFVPILKDPTATIRDTAYSSYPARVDKKKHHRKLHSHPGLPLYGMVGRRQTHRRHRHKFNRRSR